MSILGNITVRQCDQCKKTISLSSDEQYNAFYDRWHSGIKWDFCPECRDTLAVQARILDDEAAESAINAAISKYRPEVSYAR